MLSLGFYKRLNFWFAFMALGLLLGLIGFAAMGEVKDLDLWLHLKMGEWIVAHGHVPSTDVLSASFAGSPWVDHEWLFQVVAHLTRDTFGMDGLILMQVVMVLATFVVLFLLCQHRDRYLALIGLFFLLFQVYQTRFTIRPDIFSIFFLVLSLYLLERKLGRAWCVPAMFLVQVVWTNMHGYSILGVLLVFLWALADVIRRRLPLPRPWRELPALDAAAHRRLGLIFIAVVAANFVGPLGVAGALYPVKILFGMAGDMGVFFEHITELARPVTWDSLFSLVRWPYKALIILSTLSFILNWRRVRVCDLLLWAAFLAFSLTALRNMTYFALIACFVTMRNISGIGLVRILPFTFRSEKTFHVCGALLSLLIMFKLVDIGSGLAVAAYYDLDTYQEKKVFLGVAQRDFPHKAADFLLTNGIGGNFFNDFNSGAYLIGRLFPQVRVFMDGRTELRGSDFFINVYKKVWNDGDAAVFDRIVEEYGLTGAFINTATTSAPESLLKMIAARKDWRLVYFDHDALIFLRDVPQNREAIAQFGIDLDGWTPPQIDILKIGARGVTPYHHLSRALSLKTLGYLDQAMAELDMAVRVDPSYERAYRARAEILKERQMFKEAFDNRRLSAIYSGKTVRRMADLADAYIDLNDLPAAEDLLKELQGAAPKDDRVRVVVAKDSFKKGADAAAYDILRAIMAEGKDPRPLLLDLADEFEQLGQEEKAREIRQIADPMLVGE